MPLVGTESPGQIKQIVKIMEDNIAACPEELKRMEAIRLESGTHFCRRCEYCMPCEQGVQIPHVLMVKTQIRRFSFKQVVAMAKDKIATVENCIKCGECMERCPYGLPIPDMLQESLKIYQEFLDKH